MRGNVVVLFASPKQIAERRQALIAMTENAVAEQRRGDEASKHYWETLGKFEAIEVDDSPSYRKIAASIAEYSRVAIEHMDLRRQRLEQIKSQFDYEKCELEKLEARSARFV